MEAFRNQDVLNRAYRLSDSLHELASNCNEYSFKGRITRAGQSVASNITEGYERNSVHERIQYLNIAKGSCGEVWSQLMMGWSAGLIKPEEYSKLELEASEISKILWDIIRQLQKDSTGPRT